MKMGIQHNHAKHHPQHRQPISPLLYRKVVSVVAQTQPILKAIAFSSALSLLRMRGAVGARAIADTTSPSPHPYPDGEAEHYIKR